MTSSSGQPLRSLGLTARQAEVLFWVSEGKTSAEIATILSCKRGTVSKHIEHILETLAVENRTTAAAIAFRMLQSAPLVTRDAPPACEEARHG